MVFTRRVNGTGAAAYVAYCDQFPRGEGRLGSNFGEYFYSSVPVSAVSNLNSTDSQDGWFYFIGRTVVHEVKHIASVAARVENQSPNFEQSWLEEGTARHAEELWVRDSLHRVPWKGNTGWGSASTNGVFCDFNPSNSACLAADTLRRPSYGMRRQFNEIRQKLFEPWNWSLFGDASGQSGSVFYQTVWSLVRYAIDRYASSEAAFFQALTNTTQEGTANLAAVAGVPFERLLGGWGSRSTPTTTPVCPVTIVISSFRPGTCAASTPDSTPIRCGARTIRTHSRCRPSHCPSVRSPRRASAFVAARRRTSNSVAHTRPHSSSTSGTPWVAG